METFANRYDEMPYEDMLKELSQDERLQLARERLKAGRDFDYASESSARSKRRRRRALHVRKIHSRAMLKMAPRQVRGDKEAVMTI